MPTNPVANIITLNQILKLMSDFSLAHPQLNDFGFGQTSDIGTSKQMDFAYMWATFENDSLFVISPNKSIIPELSFTLLFVDKINNQENVNNTNGENSNNGQEILSDMFLVAQDFVTEVVATWSQYGVSIIGDISAFPLQDETDDKANGWGIRMTLRLKYVTCDIPI
jgi:hypothetical protein